MSVLAGPVTAAAQVKAGRDASVVSTATVAGPVEAGRDAAVLAFTQVTGAVTAGRDANVTAAGDVTGAVTSTGGAVTVVAGGNLTGAVDAKTDASVWVEGDLTGGGSVTAHRDATVNVLGQIAAPISADRDAQVFASGAISKPVHAGRDVSVIAASQVTGEITADRAATVTALAGLDAAVTAEGGDLAAFVNGSVSKALTSNGGNVNLTATGSITGPVTACANITVAGLGTIDSVLNAGGDVTVSGFGASTQVQVNAGGSATVQAVGTLDGTIDAGGSASVIALGAVTGTVTGGTGASVMAGGAFSGAVTATTGDAVLFTTDTATGSVSAPQGNASAAAGGDLRAGVSAGRTATALTPGSIGGVTVSGTTSAFAWANGSMTGTTVESAHGAARALSDGPVSGVTVTAGTDAQLASAGGSLGNSQVTADGQADVFGIGISGVTVSAGTDARVTSVGAMSATATAGRDLRLVSTGAMTVTGSAGRDADVTAYGDLSGSVAAGVGLSAWAFGSIDAGLSSAGNIDRVVTFGSLTGSVRTVNGNAALGTGSIREVDIWGDLTGLVEADALIGGVYVGGEVAPTAAVAAPLIGVVSVHDRSPFVEDPAPPVIGLGEIVSQFRAAARRFDDRQADFDQARTEILAAVAAAAADAARAVAAAHDQIRRMEQSGQASIADVVTQIRQAEAVADAKFQQSIAGAVAALEAARREARGAAARVGADLQSARAATQGEAAARLGDAMAHRAWLLGEAQKMGERMDLQKSAQLFQAAVMKQIAERVFVSTFIQKLGEFALDHVQEKLERIGTIGNFIPGVGWIIGGVANGVNAAIYAARGKYVQAGFSVFAMIPFGKVASWAGKTAAGRAAGGLGKAIFNRAGAATKAVAKFVDRMPVVGAAAKLVPCPLRTMVGLPGCFAAGTPVLTEHGAKPIEQIEIGDRVWARDESNPGRAAELKLVEDVFVRESLLWLIRVGGVTIRTTAEHPFWVVGRGWLTAHELMAGDRFVGLDGKEVVVAETQDTGEYITVHNFQVADYHTYFIGSDEWAFSVWAHNANQTCLVGLYKQVIAGVGRQMHHLLQKAAFINPLNVKSGVSVGVRGGTGTLGTQHNIIHRVIEGFWEPFRRSGGTPTNAQYLDALGRALRAAGFTPKETYKLVSTTRRYLTNQLNLPVNGLVPNVPGRFPSKFLPGGLIP
ncbi:MAG TPA: polymorphic toxin-type HINT domain-containing protein [Urbifossiella sp.]|nr:polymorphic toxin-type HINT domain-containing protein [Urbifossiella sp.]